MGQGGLHSTSFMCLFMMLNSLINAFWFSLCFVYLNDIIIEISKINRQVKFIQAYMKNSNGLRNMLNRFLTLRWKLEYSQYKQPFPWKKNWVKWIKCTILLKNCIHMIARNAFIGIVDPTHALVATVDDYYF